MDKFYDKIASMLTSKREKAFITKFYWEKKADSVIINELYIDNRVTYRRLKKKVKRIVGGFQNETSQTFFIDNV